MTNIGKTLITGVLLVELGFASYLLFPKGDQSTVEADAGMSNAVVTAGVDSRFATAHVTAGSVISAAPPARGTDRIAAAPQSPPARKVAPDPVPAPRKLEPDLVPGTAPPARGADVIAAAPQPSPARKVVPDPVPAARTVAQGPTSETQSHQQPPHTLASADAQASVNSKANPAPRIERGRDGLYRHGSNPVASAMTDQLVKESAKLDPALPPPPNQPGSNDLHRRGSNPVAAAMTEQLVRESAKLDPALPPPNRPGTQ